MCNSSSSVLVLNRTSPSLLHTFVVDTLLNFPLPFNIPVILSYTHIHRKRLQESSCFLSNRKYKLEIMADKKRNVCKRADSSILKLKRMYMCEFVF